MPVAAFPPSSDASVDAGSAPASGLPWSQVPSSPDAGATFDQFLPKAKMPVPGTGSGSALTAAPSANSRLSTNPGPGSNPGPAAPSPNGWIPRRGRPAAASAGGDAAPAAVPAPTPPAADPTALPIAAAQLALPLPPADPAPPAAPEPDAGEGDSSTVATAASAGPLANVAATLGPPARAAAEWTPFPASPSPAAAALPSPTPSASTAAPSSSDLAPAALNSPAAVSLASVPDAPVPLAPAARWAGRPGKPAAAPAPAAGPVPAAPAPAASVPEDPISEIRIQPAAPVPADHGEKSAAPATPVETQVSSAAGTAEKKTLVAVNQYDKSAPLSVGITAAQASPAMTPDSTAVGRLFSPPSISAPSGTASTPAAATPANASARVAVDAVVKLLDVQTGRSQEPVSAVSLNFKFGGDDLAIRVEWRDGEVHTQFRTDSPELRSALASQWQAVAPGTGSRATSFAAPVFSSTGDPSASASGGEREARHFGEDPGFSGQASRNRLPRPRSPAPSAAIAAALPLRASPLSSALRLHTFA
jgi:hypothetical protein